MKLYHHFQPPTESISWSFDCDDELIKKRHMNQDEINEVIRKQVFKVHDSMFSDKGFYYNIMNEKIFVKDWDPARDYEMAIKIARFLFVDVKVNISQYDFTCSAKRKGRNDIEYSASDKKLPMAICKMVLNAFNISIRVEKEGYI